MRGVRGEGYHCSRTKNKHIWGGARAWSHPPRRRARDGRIVHLVWARAARGGRFIVFVRVYERCVSLVCLDSPHESSMKSASVSAAAPTITLPSSLLRSRAATTARFTPALRQRRRM